LDNDNFEGERLKAVISWINKQFKKCLVLFGDSIHQHTLQIKGCRNETDALEQAIAMGQMACEQKKMLFEEFSCQFEYMFAHQAQQFSDYRAYRDHLWALFSKNTAFSKAVNDFSIYFVTRRNKYSNKNLHLATTYLIEELAIFACLEVRGWPIFVYPGTIGIFEEIANGKYENLPKPLRNHIHISLHIHSRGIV
jgi:tRNA-dependent cyclodipeptide synthase